MLDRDDTRARYVRERDNISWAARDTALAENLHIMASSHTLLQSKADNVSEYCCVMGLQLSIKTLRRFLFAYTRWEENVPASIIVHRDGWTPHHVDVCLRGHHKSLGVQMDPTNLNAVTLQTSKDIASQDNQTILSSRASAATKTAVLLTTTYKRIENRAKFSSLNLFQLHQLDKIIYFFNLRVICNMNDFSYALLHGDNKYGVVGLKRL